MSQKPYSIDLSVEEVHAECLAMQEAADWVASNFHLLPKKIRFAIYGAVQLGKLALSGQFKEHMVPTSVRRPRAAEAPETVASPPQRSELHPFWSREALASLENRIAKLEIVFLGDRVDIVERAAGVVSAEEHARVLALLTVAQRDCEKYKHQVSNLMEDMEEVRKRYGGHADYPPGCAVWTLLSHNSSSIAGEVVAAMILDEGPHGGRRTTYVVRVQEDLCIAGGQSWEKRNPGLRLVDGSLLFLCTANQLNPR